MTTGMRGFGVLALVGAGVLGLNGACNIKSTTYESDGGNGGSSNNTTTTTTTGEGNGGTGGNYTTVGIGGGVPQNCDADPNDACNSCFKSSCCAQIEACDAACEATYAEYIDCIFPDGAASGYNSNYCKASVGAEGAAAALIDCSVTNCYNADACGAELKDTWANFAGNFIEQYCAGCHFDGYAEDGHLGFVDTRDYSLDETWDDASIWPEQPFGNPQWFELLSYDNVALDKELIWCGLNEVLPEDCAQFVDENGDPRFPVAMRFPPSGTDGVTECWWLGEGTPCFQPTAFERARMANWIFDGLPKD
jgi:hypothetical protein